MQNYNLIQGVHSADLEECVRARAALTYYAVASNAPLAIDVCNSHSTWALMQSLIDTDTMAHNFVHVQCGAGPTYSMSYLQSYSLSYH
jgi:hypothetical protein